ncbi:hypothetical protein PRZ48_009499 [Zasmidium cellare]|uniref:Uncharacterized protein n=1 Tax=Zasmidium cellare TaxID=395010 RepID=A0ABR0ECY2_ZASCE|nr:hypothetical protein PRZ48_009499 [Zasmidium cellare]
MNFLDLAPHRQRARRQELRRQQRQSDNENTPLLKLSAELRNKMFDLALPASLVFTTSRDSHPILPKEDDVGQDWDDEGPGCVVVADAKAHKKHFALTQVCRQIRAETLQVAYSSSIFRLGIHMPTKNNEAERWVETRPSKALEAIDKIIVHPAQPDYDWGLCQDGSNFTFSFETGVVEQLRNGCEWCDEGIEDFVESAEELFAPVRRVGMSREEKLMKLFEILRETYLPSEEDLEYAAEEFEQAEEEADGQDSGDSALAAWRSAGSLIRVAPRTSVHLQLDNISGTTHTLKMGQSKRALERKRAKLRDWERRQREQDNSNTLLLKLAPELRNRIFSMALPSDQFFNTTFKHEMVSGDGQERSFKLIRTAAQYQSEFALTQVCRQIREETIKVAYSSNTFAVGVHSKDARARAERWIESRPVEVLRVIPRLILQRKNPYVIDNSGMPMNSILFDFEKKIARTISEDNEKDLLERYSVAEADFERTFFTHFVDAQSRVDDPSRLWLLQVCQNFRRGWKRSRG